MSDHIRVISVIGRFLEHSRLWYFGNDGADEYYLGSADWIAAQHDRRVEVVAPIEDRALHPRLAALFETYLTDNRQAWTLSEDGVWRQRVPDGVVRASHTVFLNDSWGRAERTAIEAAVEAVDVAV